MIISHRILNIIGFTLDNDYPVSIQRSNITNLVPLAVFKINNSCNCFICLFSSIYSALNIFWFALVYILSRL